MNRTVEIIGAKMDALEIWDRVLPYNWAVKPKKTVFPYFCSILRGDDKPVKVRFLMLEGWQTLHDFVRMRADPDFGFYSSPIEFPHLELVILTNGEMRLFRHDPGFMPLEANEAQRALAARILWESYGVLLRLEGDPKLPLKYVAEKGIFARVETADEVWEDRPLEIPDPPPFVEKISFDKADLKRAKDIPFVSGEVLHVDFRLVPSVMTKEPRPRCVYQLLGYDPKSKTAVFDLRASIGKDSGLKELWEMMPRQFLKALIERGRIPGEIRVASQRVFRFLRPLCIEIPFKISLRTGLELPR